MSHPSLTGCLLLSIMANAQQLFIASIGAELSVDSIPALLKLDPNRVETFVFVRGRCTRGDGGEGWFRFDRRGSQSTNQGTVFQPPTGTGRWLRCFSSSLNVKWFGASGRGDQDDTSFIQTTIDAGNTLKASEVRIPDGVYKVNAKRAIKLRNHTALSLSGGARLEALPCEDGTSTVISAADVDYVSITGGTIVGDREIHRGTGGEHGMGIRFDGVREFRIDSVTVSNCWGDGIYIGGTPTRAESRSGSIHRCLLFNNRRNNLSITAGVNIVVSECEVRLANGTAPEYGVDLEPNPPSGWEVREVLVRECRLLENHGAGIGVSTGLASDVTIENSVVSDNRQDGIDIANCRRIQLTANVIARNDRSGVKLRTTEKFELCDIVVARNEIRGNRASGILTHGKVDGLWIVFNQVTQNGGQNLDTNGVVNRFYAVGNQMD